MFVFFTRSALYPYDVRADYQYDFAGSQLILTELEIADGVINVPEELATNRTSFLKVSIDSSLWGNFVQPSVDIYTDKDTQTQYFEHGAAGVRYLNVSNLISVGVQRISLSGNNLSIENGPTELVQFENIVTAGKRILVIAPHPDDAEISSFGLYSSHDDVYVVTVTAGDAGGFMYDEIYSAADGVDHYLKKGEVRTWNSLTVPMLGGVTPDRTVNLGFFDATLKSMANDRNLIVKGLYTNTSDINTFRKQNVSKLAEGLNGTNNWQSLVNNLAYLLNEIKPDIIVLPSPKLDQHSDHQYATHATIEAIKMTGKRDGYLFLYTNHFILNELYPYGEMGAVISLPASPVKSNYFAKIYSHSLTPQQQQGKILTLDAMNDLRLGTDYRFYDLAFGQALKLFFLEILGKNESYFRRSVRSNELFFVIETDEVYDAAKASNL